jgi:hypothetical protein
VDGPSYLVGRTDEKVLTMFWSSTNYRCLWTGPDEGNGYFLFSATQNYEFSMVVVGDCRNSFLVFVSDRNIFGLAKNWV